MNRRKEAVLLKKRKENPVSTPIKRRPARTTEEQENRMVSYAMDLAEKQLIEGTASSQVITHFLKLGSSKEKLEKEILEKQKELIAAKTESMHSAKRIEELYQQAMSALRGYQGYSGADDISDNDCEE